MNDEIPNMHCKPDGEVNRIKPSKDSRPATCSAFATFEDFAAFLAKFGVVDAAAVEDGEGYDHNATLMAIEDAWNHWPNASVEAPKK